ncbi:hypothetical protein [Neobacillus niacini]|uniref:hypothetical protein n=1 Tax=Neobacillus niacini TaxID=86668 RepID=UPI0005EEA16D|nr:hypothetical protein [Neobacillus niacini]
MAGIGNKGVAKKAADILVAFVMRNIIVQDCEEMYLNKQVQEFNIRAIIVAAFLIVLTKQYS